MLVARQMLFSIGPAMPRQAALDPGLVTDRRGGRADEFLGDDVQRRVRARG
jgi:hypothetical protein